MRASPVTAEITLDSFRSDSNVRDRRRIFIHSSSLCNMERNLSIEGGQSCAAGLSATRNYLSWGDLSSQSFSISFGNVIRNLILQKLDLVFGRDRCPRLVFLFGVGSFAHRPVGKLPCRQVRG